MMADVSRQYVQKSNNMTMDVSFKSGLSGISFSESGQVKSDFPKNKSAFKPSGESISEHFRKALNMDKSLDNSEKKFAIKPRDINQTLTPEEHHAMTVLAINELNHYRGQLTEIDKAIAMLTESKAWLDEVMMTRNILIAG